MAKVIDIRDTDSGSLFAVLHNMNNSYVAHGNNQRSRAFAEWFNSIDADVNNLDKILPAHLTAGKPKTINASQSEYQNFLPTSVIDQQHSKSLRLETKISSDDEYMFDLEGDLEEDSDDIDSWPATDSLIASIDVAYKQNLIDYKVKAFILDKDISSLLLHVKGVRAIFDPDMPGGGGWRCPDDTPAAGQFTNRFGRGCTFGATRRIGRGLMAAAGDDLEKLGTLGRRLERRGSSRQQAQLDKFSRRAARREANAGKTRRQIVATSVAERLEATAGKLRDVGTSAPSSRRRVRRQGIDTPETGTPERRRTRRIRREVEDKTPRTPKSRRTRRGESPEATPAVERAEKRRRPRTSFGVRRQMARSLTDEEKPKPEPKKPRQKRVIKGRKPRSTEKLRERVGRRLSQEASGVLGERYVEPTPPTPEVPESPAESRIRRIRLRKPRKSSARDRRRRVALSKTNRSGLFYAKKPQTAKQKGELLPDWDTLSDDQKASVKSATINALNEIDKGWRKRLGKKKRDDLNEDEILDFLDELEKVDPQRSGILKTHLHNLLVLSDIEENDDYSKFNDIKPKLRKSILEEAGIDGTTSADEVTKPARKPRTPKVPPAPPSPPAPQDNNQPDVTPDAGVTPDSDITPDADITPEDLTPDDVTPDDVTPDDADSATVQAEQQADDATQPPLPPSGPLRFIDADTNPDDVTISTYTDSPDEWKAFDDIYNETVDSSNRWTDELDTITPDFELFPAQDGESRPTVTSFVTKADANGVTRLERWTFEWGPDDNRTAGIRADLYDENGNLLGHRIIPDVSADNLNDTFYYVAFKNRQDDATSATPDATPPTTTPDRTPKAPPTPPTPSSTDKTPDETPKPKTPGEKTYQGADVSGLKQGPTLNGRTMWEGDDGFAVDISKDIVIDSVDVQIEKADDLPQIVMGGKKSSATPNKYPTITIDGKRTSIVPNVGIKDAPAVDSWATSIEMMIDAANNAAQDKGRSEAPGWIDQDSRGISTVRKNLASYFDGEFSRETVADFFASRAAKDILVLPSYSNESPEHSAFRSNIASWLDDTDNEFMQYWDDNNPPETIFDFLDAVAAGHGTSVPASFLQTTGPILRADKSGIRRGWDRWNYTYRRGNRYSRNSRGRWGSEVADISDTINNAIASDDVDALLKAFEEVRILHRKKKDERANLIKRFQTPSKQRTESFGERSKRELVIAGELIESLENLVDELFDRDDVRARHQANERTRYRRVVEFYNAQKKRVADRKAGKSRVGGGLGPDEIVADIDVTRPVSELEDMHSKHKSDRLFSDVLPGQQPPLITKEEKALLIAMKDAYDTKRIADKDKDESSGGAAQAATLLLTNGYSDLPIKVTEAEAAQLLTERDDDGRPKWFVVTRYVSDSYGVSVTGDEMVDQWQNGERYATGSGGTLMGFGDYFATGAGSSGYGSNGIFVLLPASSRLADHKQMQQTSQQVNNIVDSLERAVGRGGRYGNPSSQRLDVTDPEAVAEFVDAEFARQQFGGSFSDEVRTEMSVLARALVEYWVQLEMDRIQNPTSDDERRHNEEIRKAQQILLHTNSSMVAVFGGYDAVTNFEDSYRQTTTDFAVSVKDIILGQEGRYVVILNRTNAMTIPGNRSYNTTKSFLGSIVDADGKPVWRG